MGKRPCLLICAGAGETRQAGIRLVIHLSIRNSASQLALSACHDLPSRRFWINTPPQLGPELSRIPDELPQTQLRDYSSSHAT